MRKPFQILAAALVLAAASARAQSPADLPAKVDSIAKAVLAATGVPSATVAVVTHGKLAYAQAYGVARLQPLTAAKPDMRYGVGSISKQFTAAAILMLQQQGKLSLDDKVAKFVPGLTSGNQVTIRELLSHTSGYQDFWPQDYVPPEMEKPVTAQAILDRWARRPLDFPPGSRWQYSNTNYVIAGLIVEKASGVPFYQFIQSRILDLLRMTTAVNFDAAGPKGIEPVGYMRYGLGPLRPATPTGPGWMWAAGELAMTARDLAKWDIAMIDRSLLTPRSYQLLETTVLLNDGVSSGYGLGVDVGMRNGHRSISHGGEVAGFTAQNVVFPDDSAAVVVLTNQDAAPAAGNIAAQIGAVLFQTEDAGAKEHAARAKRIFEGLQQGRVDRALFTANANAYFNAQALEDFRSSLSPLGAPASFTEMGTSLRGGMRLRSYRATFAGGKTLRVWTYELPDGKLEQYQLSPV